MYNSYNKTTQSLKVLIQVQMDKTKIEKRKHNRNLVTYDNWIFDSFERDSKNVGKKCFLTSIPNHSYKCYCQKLKIQRYWIINNCWDVYNSLKLEGYLEEH